MNNKIKKKKVEGRRGNRNLFSPSRASQWKEGLVPRLMLCFGGLETKTNLF
jgi:hypothetical protein